MRERIWVGGSGSVVLGLEGIWSLVGRGLGMQAQGVRA